MTHYSSLLFRLSMAVTLLVFLGCNSSRQTISKTQETKKTSTVNREFRAAWVATVANINWPSKPGLSTAEQQKEAIELLDFLKEHNYNAVVFQVRPQADALYKSSLEPWSYYLTGTQGKAPSPYYDPLEFWVEAAHDRGLELHVWLNPYRAHHISGGPVSDQSIVKKMPELMVHLKEGYWWFDPSRKETQDHGVNVVMDIVKRYDIDGVHFDDYFYPYASYNKGEDFPDTLSRRMYLQSGGKLSVADWRRQSVDNFIERLYSEIKKEKPHVKFGLSPFGIWRPGHPASVQGMDQYNELYADAKKWLNKGWIDYFSPQLYWPINRIPQSFPVLLGWWESENTQKRHLWPGISVSRDTAAISVNETFNQIMVARGMLPESPGVIHWSLSSVTRNPNMAAMLKKGPYQKQALVPESPWLNQSKPQSPDVTIKQLADSVEISWNHPRVHEVFRWVVYTKYGDTENWQILNRKDRSVRVAPHNGKEKLTSVSVTAISNASVESDKKELPANVLAILPRSAWNAAEARPFKSQVPVRITVHHEGGKVLNIGDNAAQRIKNIQTWGMGPDRNWTDVPYHYLVAPDGTVYEGRNALTAGETATEYDPSGHLLISFLGNYQQQPFNDHLLEVLAQLIAHLSTKFSIPPTEIGAHKDYSKMTTCPGEAIYSHFENGDVAKRVQALLNQK